MAKPCPCHFCGGAEAAVTVTRTTPGIPPNLRLCQRCAYVHQLVIQVQGLEAAMPAPPCLHCGKLSKVTANVADRKKRMLGSYRLCEACMQKTEYSIGDVLRHCTAWTPGILELPPPSTRIFPPPPGQIRPGLN